MAKQRDTYSKGINHRKITGKTIYGLKRFKTRENRQFAPHTMKGKRGPPRAHGAESADENIASTSTCGSKRQVECKCRIGSPGVTARRCAEE